MSWNLVETILEKVFSLMADPNSGRAWLRDLRIAEDGPLLGYCLAIDVASSAIPPTSLAGVLEHLPATADARSSFYFAVDRHPTSLRCQSALMSDVAEPVEYVRILELGDFITYYLRPVYGYTTDPADVATVRKLFLRGAPRPLGDITDPWSGRNRIVWVLPKKDVDSILAGVSGVGVGSAAEELADRLGLNLSGGVGPENSLDLVAVTYPSAFEHEHDTRCRQPTVFDASWDRPGNLYISHRKEDNWGRTRSCTGARPELPERVHPELSRITDSFQLIHVGFTTALMPDRTTIIAEAESRLKAAYST